ncbi:MAG: NAD-dependent epimerase/dehydratase family protein [Butyricicoccus sp.]
MSKCTVDLSGKTVLITGAAGFVGAQLARCLLERFPDTCIVGLDNLNDYYDVSLKQYRLQQIADHPSFRFVKGDLADADLINELFEQYRPQVVVNLAAQAGVRYSITNPDAYISSNLIGFYHILEACRRYPVEHLVYASSSSVYGLNQKVPYSTEDKTDQPVSLYAATKKSNELMAHAYSKLYGIPCTGLRFFTVYGPAGRPDMAYFHFTDRMRRGEPIQLFNYGDMKRDFTYIDDIVDGVVRVMQKAPEQSEGAVRCCVYNIGNHQPVSLLLFVETLERCLLDEGIIMKPAEKELLPMQPGDVYQTYADVSALERDFGFCPATSLEDGLRQFAHWYRAYYIEREKQ